MISVTAHVVEKRAELDKLIPRADGLKRLCATVGWHHEEGSRPKLVRRTRGAVTTTFHTNVATVALVNETGSYHNLTVARPVHRGAIRNAGFRAGLVAETASAYRRFLTSGASPESVLRCMGDYWRSRFDRMFDGENSWEPLKDSTILRRRQAGNMNEDPLVDTRQMRDTTTVKVQLASLVERPVWEGP